MKKQSSIEIQREQSQIEATKEVHDLLLEPTASGFQPKAKMNPIFIQMPCTLPFNPEKAQAGSQIGKLRIMKSGKVVMRVADPTDPSKHIDLLVNKGISNSFYQELVSVTQAPDLTKQDKHSSTPQPTLNIVCPVKEKLVMTPDLESLLGSNL